MSTPSDHTYNDSDRKATGTAIHELATGVAELVLDRSVFDPVPNSGGVPSTFSFGGNNSCHTFDVESTAPPASATTKRKLQVPDDVDEEADEWNRNHPAESPILRPLTFDGVLIGVFAFDPSIATKASRSKAALGRQTSSRFIMSRGRFNRGGESSAGGGAGETKVGEMKPRSKQTESIGDETNVTDSQSAYELVGRAKRLKIGE
jgi:hypothetical protein